MKVHTVKGITGNKKLFAGLERRKKAKNQNQKQIKKKNEKM